MLRAGVLPALLLIVLGPAAAADGAGGPDTGLPRTIFEMPLPGGLEAAQQALDDGGAADRSQFLLEVIRRLHNAPPSPAVSAQDRLRTALIEHLERQALSAGQPVETIPLPLAPDLWIETVFKGQASPSTLAIEIIRSRGASLLYTGLLSLDDDTRAWLGEHPDLIDEVVMRYPGGFAAAAPGLRVRNGRLQLPGGDAAAPAWSGLAGSTPAEPVEFVRGLLSREDGRPAYIFGAFAALTAHQLAFALRLDGMDAEREDAARRLLRVFERVGPSWTLEGRAFWRPARDPALLLAGLEQDRRGRPVLPGTREFWNDVFAGRRLQAGAARPAPGAWSAGKPADFVWIAEQVFRNPIERELRFQSVLFASRVLQNAKPSWDAYEAALAVREFPALVDALERAGIRNPIVYASAARRARSLEAIGGSARQARVLGQYQGALALLVRAHVRGTLSLADLERLIPAMSAVEPARNGEYEGRLVRFLVQLLESRQRAPAAAADDLSDTIDQELVRLVAGAPAAGSTLVEWEGTRYHVDLPYAEVLRVTRLLGEDQPPYLALATVLLDVADLEVRRPEVVRPLDRRLAALRQYSEWRTAARFDPEPECVGRAAELLGKASAGSSRSLPSGVVPMLRECADDLAARGLSALAYAVALGNPERIAITAAEAASRHQFDGRRSIGGAARAWQAPDRETQAGETWKLTGALLGLDVRLADFALVAISKLPPQHRPTLNEQDRRAMTEAVVLIRPASLTDALRDRIVSALRTGRERVAAAGTPEALHALSDEAGLDAARRSLLPWVAAHDPQRLPSVLSPAELLRLGLEAGDDPSLDAWGAPARARLGCDCLQLRDSRRPELLSGRWNTGMLASSFPDLNIRLAELLAELQMPARLLAAVLPPATLDFVNGAVSRDQDDRRGPTEFVQALGRDRVEQYLALLTADGPLVPIEEGRAGDAVGPPVGEAPQ